MTVDVNAVLPSYGSSVFKEPGVRSDDEFYLAISGDLTGSFVGDLDDDLEDEDEDDVTGLGSEDSMDDFAYCFYLPLALSVPTHELSLDHDEIDRQVVDFLTPLVEQISRTRSAAPQRPKLPEDKVDEALEDENEENDQENAVLLSLLDTVAYWPPEDGKLGLGLIWRQEDNGLAIEIALFAHGSTGHEQSMQTLASYNGSLQPMPSLNG